MTIQEQIDALKKDFENKIAELEKQVKGEEKSNVWKPKKGEKYFCIDAEGDIFNYYWEDHDDEENMYEFGNCFKTEEETEWEKQHRIVTTKLKRFVQENDPNPIKEEDWKNKNLWKYVIRYDYYKDECTIYSLVSTKSANEIYASNEAVLRQAIEYIDKERLKKYYFGVKYE